MAAISLRTNWRIVNTNVSIGRSEERVGAMAVDDVVTVDGPGRFSAETTFEADGLVVTGADDAGAESDIS